LDALLTWRETLRASRSLTVLYDWVLYVLEDTPQNQRLIHRYVEVWEYPDGRIEIRAGGRALACGRYDKLAEVDQGAVIEHKRLAHPLQVAQALQAQRDNRISGSPSRTNRGQPVRATERPPGAKKQRAFTQADMEAVIVKLAQATKAEAKPGRRSARAR
jgi:hypothetical protein